MDCVGGGNIITLLKKNTSFNVEHQSSEGHDCCHVVKL